MIVDDRRIVGSAIVAITRFSNLCYSAIACDLLRSSAIIWKPRLKDMLVFNCDEMSYEFR